MSGAWTTPRGSWALSRGRRPPTRQAPGPGNDDRADPSGRDEPPPEFVHAADAFRRPGQEHDHSLEPPWRVHEADDAHGAAPAGRRLMTTAPEGGLGGRSRRDARSRAIAM